MNAPTDETTNQSKSMSIAVAFAIIIGVWLTFSAGVYLLLRADVGRVLAWLGGVLASDIGASLVAGFLLTLVLGLWASRRRA